MMSLDGTLHIAYWSNGNHITYVSYSYDSVSDTLTLKTGPTQLDTAGAASHPVLAVSPADGSVTVAWISEATTPHHILARTKLSSAWGTIEMVSNAAVNVWTYLDPYGGLSVDQGPSLVVTLDGNKHLTYIEAADSTGNYGRTHYVSYTSPAGWVDSALNYYSHDPALATNNNSAVYIFGHGLYLDPAPCTSADAICLLKRNADGSWGTPQLFATPPSGETFDASVSTKWSVAGWNRPELIEVAFFSGQTSNYWNMNLYYGTIDFATTKITNPITVKNDSKDNALTSGVVTLEYRFKSSQPWLTIAPASGECGAMETQSHTVSVDRSRMAYGQNTGTMTSYFPPFSSPQNSPFGGASPASRLAVFRDRRFDDDDALHARRLRDRKAGEPSSSSACPWRWRLSWRGSSCCDRRSDGNGRIPAACASCRTRSCEEGRTAPRLPAAPAGERGTPSSSPST